MKLSAGKKRNNSGLSIIEVTIAMAMASIVALGLMQIIHSLQKTTANVDVNASFSGVVNDLEMVMANSSLCGSSFRESDQSSSLQFNPPNNSDNYIKAVPYIMLDDNIIIQQDGLGSGSPASYARDLVIKKLQLRRMTAVPPQATSYMDNSGNTVNGQKYIVRLEIEAERKRGTLAGQSLQRNWLMEITTNDSNNRVARCSNRETPTILRAIATRNGVAISGIQCNEPIPQNRYRANSCTDNDGNRLCDDDRHLATVDHPVYGSSKWVSEVPVRSSGPPPVGTKAEEGRCLVNIQNNTSSEDPNDIFHIYNSPDFAIEQSGLGCRVDNGWYLTGCFRADNGNSDSDINIKKTATAEYCISNDYAQPHVGVTRAYATRSIGLTIICMKLE